VIHSVLSVGLTLKNDTLRPCHLPERGRPVWASNSTNQKPPHPASRWEELRHWAPVTHHQTGSPGDAFVASVGNQTDSTICHHLPVTAPRARRTLENHRKTTPAPSTYTQPSWPGETMGRVGYGATNHCVNSE
jgi:hypothetical protein